MNYTVPTKENIEGLVVKWAIKTFGPSFKFRPKQKETIVSIIYDWLNNALDYGITEKEFWGMTLAEIVRAMDSFERKRKRDLQSKA